MASLWLRLLEFAETHGLVTGLTVDAGEGEVVAYVGVAVGRGPTANAAIGEVADALPALHGWTDDRAVR